MSFSFGTTLRVQVFGQSHTDAVGCVIEGLPAGMRVDQEALQAFMDRRAPGRTPWSTPRKEPDRPRIVSGLNDRGETCGMPLAAVIENTNVRSADYEALRRVPRPGHADLAAWYKWCESHDVRGGGAFSARLTAPLCVAGGIALQALSARGVSVAAHVAQVADVYDVPLDALGNSAVAQHHLAEQVRHLHELPTHAFPTLSEEAAELMVERIDRARRDQD